MATGTLTVQARTADGALPIPGVKVQILDDQGRPLFALTTDESGDTLGVTLQTISKTLSQNPYIAGTPYVSYQVLAQAPGFDSLHISGIPIFEGENTLQPLALQIAKGGQRSQTELVIGPPAVAQQTQRLQEGPLTEPYLLRHVVIPNPITVHLGRPDAAAPDVQVPFPDYVKNVASHEIYPTWPENALKANIYAIITFALNRVFTEWYRNRGYQFDITNSTAYDQYFVYGGPIYSSVSRIVDSIFNEYVRRQGHTAPYFTSFCNGTTATCPGLSQWGTVTLAEQGLSPLQILRSYYPKDVEIAQTDLITDVITSYPGTPLKPGSTGLDTETVQAYLSRIRRNYPAIPEITDPPGVFGESTLAAVRKFQEIFHLDPDGIVGKATWYKLSGIYAAVARLAELDSEGTALGIGTVPPSALLRSGAKGQDVVTLQYLLSVIAEYDPYIPRPSQNGTFDSQTLQSVTAFQRQMDLNPDGIVGPLTWQALYRTYWAIRDNAPSPGPQPGYFEYTVRPGDTLWLLSRRFHTTVAELQQLNRLSGDRLDVGQVLKIPSAAAFSYTVQPGDTLWLLSRRFHTTVEEIQRLNNLAGDRLDVGQVLLIPSA